MSSLGRGEFAQRASAKAIGIDCRKDGLVWGVRVYGTGADDGKFADVVVDTVIRDMTTKEIEYWGKGKISNGWKVTIAGNCQYLSTPFGTLGVLAEDIILVRGTSLDLTKPRPVILNAEQMIVASVGGQYQSGKIDEYWLFVGAKDGGPTRV